MSLMKREAKLGCGGTFEKSYSEPKVSPYQGDNNSFTFEPFHFWAACHETRRLGL
jgi:hypothetical protein